MHIICVFAFYVIYEGAVKMNHSIIVIINIVIVQCYCIL